MNNFAQKIIDAGKPIVATLADSHDLQLLREDDLVVSATTDAGAPVWDLTAKGREVFADLIPVMMAPGAARAAERDPNGVDPHSGGAKLDAGKNRLGLVLGGFANALQAVGEVGTAGANKYSDNGWTSVSDGEARYTDAMLRHLFKHMQGELIDPDLGVPHLSQVCWNCLAVLELMLRAEK